jgi:hypothetical protein
LSWFLLWKGKGTNPGISPDGSFIGYERGGGVVLESTMKKVEIYRNPQGMDPQWWSNDEFAFRIAGQSHFYTYDIVGDQVSRQYPAPGAVFLCNNRHWCTWEKRPGRLWVDGKVVKEGSLRPYRLTEGGEVLFGNVPPITDTRPDEMAAAVRVSWTTTPAGFVVMALELPEKKLKVYVEERA